MYLSTVLLDHVNISRILLKRVVMSIIANFFTLPCVLKCFLGLLNRFKALLERELVLQTQFWNL